jgi:hypothetical protein
MALALELPDEYSSDLESGAKTMTFQLRDKISIGDIITIMAGDTKRKVKVTGKAWIPETEMSDKTRQEIGSKVPKEVGFSGAFQITFDYSDSGDSEKPEDAKLDLISKRMDEEL